MRRCCIPIMRSGIFLKFYLANAFSFSLTILALESFTLLHISFFPDSRLAGACAKERKMRRKQEGTGKDRLRNEQRKEGPSSIIDKRIERKKKQHPANSFMVRIEDSSNFFPISTFFVLPVILSCNILSAQQHEQALIVPILKTKKSPAHQKCLETCSRMMEFGLKPCLAYLKKSKPFPLVLGYLYMRQKQCIK